MRDQINKILLVEDNAAHVELVLRAFEPYPENYQLFTAGLFKEACDQIPSLNPDLIIADYRLPDGEGTNLIHCGGNRGSLPVILLTSHGDEKLAVAALKAGVLDYVVKSADTFQNLPRIANRCLREWRTLQDRKRAEHRLRESQEKLQTVLAHAPVLLWTVDRQGSFTFWEGKKYVTGLSESEGVVGRTIYDLFENRYEILSNFERALGGEAFTAQENFSDRVLETHYQPIFDRTGKLTEVIGVCTDITERVKATEELQRLYAAIEQSADEIIITDSNGGIRYVNPAFERNTGYERPAIISSNVNALKSVHHEAGFYEELWSTLHNGQVWKGRFTDTNKEGTLYFCDATISPIRDRAGTISGFVWIKRDVTSRLALEKQLMQAQKMEAIGTLANGVAHDFNNILGAIIGYAEMALFDAGEGSTQYNNLKHVLQAGERASQLVKQILAFSRQTAGEALSVQVQPIAKEVLQLLRAAIPAHIRIKADLASDTSVLADPTQIHQILMNLCSNASHAMQHKGGELSMTLQDVRLEDEAAQRIPNTKPGHYVRITVKDTGPGISPDAVDRIFDPFYTTKSPSMGTGLGLSVVSNIVAANSGFIDMENHPGRGVAFHIYLPASGEHAPKPEAEKQRPPRGDEHILFVDDEKFLTDVGEQILNRQGYRVTTTNRSLEALEMFRRSPDRFDLVISDLTMPNMTGDRLAAELLRIRPDLPIIICTGMSERLTVEKVKKLGVCGVVNKPVVLSQLAQLVRQALDRKPMKDEGEVGT